MTTSTHGGSRVGPASASHLLVLAGSFELSNGGVPVPLPHSVERVLACLALIGGPVHRSKLAGLLWSDVPERRAANNLRTALWRLQGCRAGLVEAKDNRLRLTAEVTVDVVEMSALAHRLIARSGHADLDHLHWLLPWLELLPDWDYEWVAADRERLRLLRLEALERASHLLMERGHMTDALLAAQAAVETEPLRESTWRLIVQVHLARGNVGEAVRCYRTYRHELHREFGIAPSPAMDRLFQGRAGAAPVTLSRDHFPVVAGDQEVQDDRGKKRDLDSRRAQQRRPIPLRRMVGRPAGL